MNEFLIFLATLAGCFLFAALIRKFSPETLVDGFMDYEKAKELAPTVFSSKKNSNKTQ